MNTKRTIRKLFITAIWILVGGGLVSLLLAANSNKKKQVCSDYTIVVKSKGEKPVIADNEVLQWLRSVAKGNIRQQPVKELDLHSMELLVEKNAWVKDAELWFDNRSVLHVVVEERSPLARVFTTSSGSYYLDEELHRLPLKKGWMIELPVFTGFPDRNKWTKKDSLLGKDIIQLADHISRDEFWKAQIEQVDMDSRGQFDLVTLVGNNIIRLGKVEDLESKFNRLDLFYKKVLSKTGFEKYAAIDVRFKGQIVGQKKANN